MIKKVMVVDDSNTVRMSLKYFLELENFKVIEASEGKEAYDIIKNNDDIDFFIIDVNMPIMDGITLTSKVRKLKNYRYTPILILTTEIEQSKKIEGKKAGASGWMIKPFDPKQLIKIIKRFLYIQDQ